MKLQLTELFHELDNLQLKYGNKNLNAVYGAGCTKEPDLMFVLMNPTGKNFSAKKDWAGIKTYPCLAIF